MLFAGLQKLTLLDYPEHVACTLFTQGCNLLCPFCQNSSLINPCQAPENPILEEDILSFLKKRQGTLDGVCITGGEPLMQEELPRFIRTVRSMGFLVKLDTNGTQPERLEALLREGLLDMVAMDIKNSPAHYAMTVGKPHMSFDCVQKSIDLLKSSGIAYEFRTTVVDELHKDEDMLAIGAWLEGDSPYYLQCYVDSEQVLRRGLHAPGKEKLERFRELLLPKLPNTHLRGV